MQKKKQIQLVFTTLPISKSPTQSQKEWKAVNKTLQNKNRTRKTDKSVLASNSKKDDKLIRNTANVLADPNQQGHGNFPVEV